MDRDYHSIGEVLQMLTGEFSDITISKIRFLESQGLIDPERTPAGYRKFYEGDIERLRFILREQKENFLPLKVIKDRLEGDDVAEPDPSSHPSGHEAARVPAWMNDPRVQARPARTDAVVTALGGSTASLTAEELAEASGLSQESIGELERFGLLQGRVAGRFTYFDEQSLVIAKLAASFGHHGVEPRHLRMYRTAADKEMALFEQLILPLVKQRNPQARARAGSLLLELEALGAKMRSAMMRQSLRHYSD